MTPKEIDKHSRCHGWYGWLPAKTEQFIKVLRNHKLLNTGGSFLDIGSGAGHILLAAHHLAGFSRADGIEIDEACIAPSQALLNGLTSTITHGSAFDFERYADYDVIYTYGPLSGSNPEGYHFNWYAQFHPNSFLMRLYRLVWGQMKEGAIFIDLHGHYLGRPSCANGWTACGAWKAAAVVQKQNGMIVSLVPVANDLMAPGRRKKGYRAPTADQWSFAQA